MIDWSKPVQTRNGCEVLIYTRESTSSNEFPIVGEFRSSDDGKWHLIRWRADGTYRPCLTSDNSMDLVNVPEEPKRHTLWLNVYKAKGDDLYTQSYLEEEWARKNSHAGCIACFKLEFQEGDGLENHESPEQRLPASLVGGEVTTDYQPPEPKRSWP